MVLFKDSVPFSEQYDDVYFSRTGGVDESSYVFLGGNHLTERFQNSTVFSILELGFGTGLNFFLTWKHFRRLAPPHSRLVYFACEKHPLSNDELQSALGHFPEITDQLGQFVQNRTPLIDGFNNLVFENAAIRLVLLIGDATEQLRKIREGSFDALYLDGFSPAKNPDLWSIDLFKQLARLSHNETTLATYSASGEMRRNLESVGFDIDRIKGFGSKKHMSVGAFRGQTSPNTDDSRDPTPTQYAIKSKKHVTIIGAGLAGCWMSYCLTQRGFRVTLLETDKDLALHASGNPIGLVYPHLTSKGDPIGSFSIRAFNYFYSWLISQGSSAQAFYSDCGVDITLTNYTLNQMNGILKQHRFSSDFAFIQESIQHSNPLGNAQGLNPQSENGQEENPQNDSTVGDGEHKLLSLPLAGIIDPRELCKYLITQSAETNLLKIHFQSKVKGIERKDDAWILETEGLKESNHRISCDSVVFANALGLKDFSEFNWIQLEANRGQLAIAGNSNTKLLRAFCYDGYTAPEWKGRTVFGTTYDNRSVNAEPTTEDRNKILLAAEKALGHEITWNSIEDRVAFRCASQDRHPLVGQIPEPGAFREYVNANKTEWTTRHRMQGWTTQAFEQVMRTSSCFSPDLYLFNAFGSRGITNIPLCAEILATTIDGVEPIPLESDLLYHLEPMRFLYRKWRKNEEL